MEDTNTGVVDSSPAAETPVVSTPEVSTTTTPSPRPTSMRDAFEQVAAKADAATGDAATTVPPASPEGTPAKLPGPIPFDVHKTTLENARAETERIKSEWKAYEFARSVDAGALKGWVDLIQETQGDAIAILERLTAEIANDPVQSERLSAFAGKQLAARRGEAEPQPDTEIVDANGQVVSTTYSAAQLAKRDAWRERQLMAKVSKMVAPLQQSHDAAQRAEQTAHAQAEASAWSGGFGKELTSYTGFTEHKAAIGQDVLAQLQRLPANDPRGNDPAFLEAATLRAYNRIVSPKLPALIQAQQLASLKQKAVAQTENPSRSATTLAARPKNPAELARWMATRAAESRG